MDFSADGRDTCRAANELDRIDLVNAQAGFFEGTLKWRRNAVKNVHDELFIQLPLQSRRSVNVVHNGFNAERCLCICRKDFLEFLGGCIQPERCFGVRKYIDLIFGLELLREVPDESIVDVTTAQVRVVCSAS